MNTTEIDVLEFAERGEEVPHAPVYRVRIDGEKVKVETPRPTGELLLSKVGKRPCAFELIEEFVHSDNDVVEPAEEVDLRKKGLKGFITAQKEIVTIFINGDPYSIERGARTVKEIRLFRDEPGVLKIANPYSRLRRGYEVLRMPESVVVKVHEKLRNRR